MLLQSILDRDLIDIRSDNVKDWQEALYQSGTKLLKHRYIHKGYLDEIVKNVVENGPYIVIVPGIAMPHALAQSKNALGTAISLTKFSKPVIFNQDDPNSYAQLFFILVARDPEQHLKNISELSDLLMTDGLVEQLLKINTVEDFKNVITASNRKER